jgi:plasmid stability protein
MSELVISNMDATVLARLEARAAIHGNTLEGEAKEILASVVGASGGNNWDAVDAIRKRLTASRKHFGDSVELLREDRDR